MALKRVISLLCHTQISILYSPKGGVIKIRNQRESKTGTARINTYLDTYEDHKSTGCKNYGNSKVSHVLSLSEC